MQQKQCSKCKEVKLLSEFSKGNCAKDGLSYKCKVCVREYYQNNKEKWENRKYNESRTIYNHEYHQQNKEASKKYYQEYTKEYYQRPEVKERRRKYADEYYQDEGNRAARREQARIYNSKRISREKGFPSTLTIEQWNHSLDYFDGCCAACGRQLNDMFGEFKASIDHWIPSGYDGDDNPGTVAANIVPLCCGAGGCNNSKNVTMPNTWLAHKFGKSKAKQIAKRVQTYFDSLE